MNEVKSRLKNIDDSITVMKTTSSDWEVLFPFRIEEDKTLCYRFDGETERKQLAVLQNAEKSAIFYLWNGISTFAVPATTMAFFSSVNIGGRFLQERNKFAAAFVAAAMNKCDKQVTFIIKGKTLLAILSGSFEPISQLEEFEWVLNKWTDEWMIKSATISARKTRIVLESKTKELVFQTSSIGKSSFVCDVTDKATRHKEQVNLKHTKGFKQALQNI